MKRKIKKLGIIGTLFFLFYYLNAQEKFQTLNDLKVVANQVIISLSGETKYHAFKISNPPRLVVELTNTEYNLSQKEIDVNNDLIVRIRGGQFENEPVKIARIVLDLKKMVEYQIESQNNVITLVLNPSQDSQPTEASRPTEIAQLTEPP